jgi:capsule polysaccharide export protein KpsE/RkpR
MFGKSKLKKEPLLTKKTVEEDKNELANIEAELAETQEIINSFSQPFRDITAQINGLKFQIEFEKKNFGGDHAASKKALVKLETEAMNVDKICREALKNSGQLDKFVELTDKKMALLRGDTSESQYKLPTSGHGR